MSKIICESVSIDPEYVYIDEDGNNIVPVYYRYEEDEGIENSTTEYQYIDGIKDEEVLESGGSYVVEEFCEQYIYESPNQIDVMEQQQHEQEHVLQEAVETHIDEVIDVVARGSQSDIKKKKGPTTKLCEFCGIVVKHPSKIEAHMRTHTGERPYSCNYCGQTFTQRTPWKSHMKRHVGDTPYKCSFCTKAFPNPSTCKAHEKRVHLKKSTTLISQDKSYENQPQTSEVIFEAIKNENGKQEYVYQVCGLHLQHVSKLEAHMITHVGNKYKPLQCEFCNLQLSSLSAYNVHNRRFHSTQKQHSCRFQCGKTFPTQSNRNEHEKIVHHKIKRYQCCINNCDKLFTRRLYLCNHFAKCHSDWESIPEEMKGNRVVAIPYNDEISEQQSSSKSIKIVTHSDGIKYIVEVMGPLGQPPFRDPISAEEEYINLYSVINLEESLMEEPPNDTLLQFHKEFVEGNLL